MNTFAIVAADPKTRGMKRREAMLWSFETTECLKVFRKCLFKYDKDWKQFSRQGVDYFIDPGASSSSSSTLTASLEAIDASFADLRGLLQRVEDLMKELTKDYPQGVSHNHSFPLFVINSRAQITSGLK
jgi:hypothetical protein